VMQRWRKIADAYPDGERVLVGETYVLDLEHLIAYYGDGSDELHMAFNFLFVHAPLEAEVLREIVEQMESDLPPGGWPVWTGSNHDAGRLTTRWAAGDERRARCALTMLLTLRGTPFLYAGDEIALPDVPVPADRVKDPVGVRTGDPSRGRDGCRTPLPWGDERGFSAAEPWLPIGEGVPTVAAQRDDPASTLRLVRDLIALRRSEADLRDGAYATLPAPAGAWCYGRGERFAVALNLSPDPVEIEALAGEIAVATDRGRDGERVDGTLALPAFSAALVRR
jgi:alpha-glucosidase